MSSPKKVLDILEEQGASHYVDGVAYHWYMQLEGLYEFTEVSDPLSPFPDWGVPLGGGGAQVKPMAEKIAADGKFMYATEACNGFILGQESLNQYGPVVGPAPGAWGYGYSYSHDILAQMQSGAISWTDWNMALGWNGMPTLRCDSTRHPIPLERSPPQPQIDGALAARAESPPCLPPSLARWAQPRWQPGRRASAGLQ